MKIKVGAPPDGNIITVCAKHFLCSEVLFLPKSPVKKPVDSATLSFQSNMKCDVYIRTVVRQCRVVKRHDHVPVDQTFPASFTGKEDSELHGTSFEYNTMCAVVLFSGTPLSER